jgi:hypothetical protein
MVDGAVSRRRGGLRRPSASTPSSTLARLLGDQMVVARGRQDRDLPHRGWRHHDRDTPRRSPRRPRPRRGLRARLERRPLRPPRTCPPARALARPRPLRFNARRSPPDLGGSGSRFGDGHRPTYAAVGVKRRRVAGRPALWALVRCKPSAYRSPIRYAMPRTAAASSDPLVGATSLWARERFSSPLPPSRTDDIGAAASPGRSRVEDPRSVGSTRRPSLEATPFDPLSLHRRGSQVHAAC